MPAGPQAKVLGEQQLCIDIDAGSRAMVAAMGGDACLKYWPQYLSSASDINARLDDAAASNGLSAGQLNAEVRQ